MGWLSNFYCNELNFFWSLNKSDNKLIVKYVLYWVFLYFWNVKLLFIKDQKIFGKGQIVITRQYWVNSGCRRGPWNHLKSSKAAFCMIKEPVIMLLSHEMRIYFFFKLSTNWMNNRACYCYISRRLGISIF